MNGIRSEDNETAPLMPAYGAPAIRLRRLEPETIVINLWHWAPRNTRGSCSFESFVSV